MCVNTKKLKEQISATHKHGLQLAREVAQKTRVKQALEVLNRQRWALLNKAKNHPFAKPYTMYDAIELDQFPAWSAAVASYVDGKWPIYWKVVQRFPKAKHLSIAVFASDDADCLDIETGDATPEQAGPWARRQKGLHKHLVVLYFSVSNKDAVETSLRAHGVKRSEVKLWGAHYTYVPHLEPGFDAIQYTDKALGRNLDASLCKPDFM